MNNSLGWLTLFLTFIFILSKKKDISIFKLLFVGFYLRSSLVFLDQYFISLPGGNFDSIGYQKKAIDISNEYGLKILFNMFQEDNYLISRIISIFYTIAAPSEMMAKAISVAIGTISIYLFYNLLLLVWNNKIIALRASWIFALMPSMCLYSSLVLREVYTTFFLIITLFPIIIFTRKMVNKKINSITWNNFSLNNHLFFILYIFFGFYILKYFHGAMFLGIFILIFFYLYYFFKEEFKFIRNKKAIRIKLFYVIFLLLLPIFLWISNVIKIPYIPEFGLTFNLIDILQRRFDISVINVVNGVYGSNFPSFLIPNNLIDFIPKVFMRIIYFLYSPFPWDIKRFEHLIGLLNSIILIYISICCWFNRRKIFQKPELKLLFLLLFSYIVIYAIGTGNFGTSIRHQTKFIFILICLAAPKLYNFDFNLKKSSVLKK